MIVQNSNINNPQFTARNPEIRRADKIMRNMMNEYPAFSVSKVTHYNIFKKFPDKTIERLKKPFFRLMDLRNSIEIDISRRFSHMDSNLAGVKREKVANCGEYAIMAKAAFMANGFNDAKTVRMRVTGKERHHLFFHKKVDRQVDHSVLIVNAGKDAQLDNPKTYNKHAFIVDPWAGFVDYVSNAFNKYKGIFLKDENQKIKNPKFILEETNRPLYSLTMQDCKLVADKHPNLVV